MKNENKNVIRRKRGISLSDGCYSSCKANLDIANCESINDFIEKAIKHYVGYLHAESDNEYLCTAFGAMIEGNLNQLMKITTQNTLRYATMINVLAHLVAPLRKVNTPQDFERLYKHCFKEALKTNGNIDISEIPKAELGISGNEHWQEDSL